MAREAVLAQLELMEAQCEVFARQLRAFRHTLEAPAMTPPAAVLACGHAADGAVDISTFESQERVLMCRLCGIRTRDGVPA